jgi:hypothetical protein
MIDPLWLMRARMWVKNPPSAKRVKFIFALVAISLLVAALEYFGFWPDWATAQRIPRRF